jgi:hypothetical protein
METKGPITVQAPNKPPATLPGVGVPQFTAEQKKFVEANWFDLGRLMIAVNEVLLKEGKPAADSLIKWVNDHK